MLDNIIDISRWQGNVDFAKVKAAGIDAVIIKSTDGKYYRHTDYYLKNSKAAAAEGLMIGAYHWFNSDDPKLQADYFMSVVNVPGVLLCLDYEVRGTYIGGVVKFAERVFEKTGRFPVLYSGFLIKEEITKLQSGSYMLDILKQMPLWISHYTPDPQPKLPAKPWTDWVMWQYTEKGKVDGIAGDVDRNRFNGSPELLAKFWNSPSPAAAVGGINNKTGNAGKGEKI